MDCVLEFLQAVGDFLFRHLMLWNMLFAIAIVFFERREPKSVWAWLLLLYFVPILGFIFYLLVGIDMRKRKMFRIKEVEDHISEAIRQQEHQLKSRQLEELDPNIAGFTDLVMFNLENCGAMLTDSNDVDILVDGNVKFDTLIEDLKRAESFIHIQYYIIKDDVLFNRIREVLEQKVKEGVEVRVLFDAMGCRSVNHRYWKKLNDNAEWLSEACSERQKTECDPK